MLRRQDFEPLKSTRERTGDQAVTQLHQWELVNEPDLAELWEQETVSHAHSILGPTDLLPQALRRRTVIPVLGNEDLIVVPHVVLRTVDQPLLCAPPRPEGRAVLVSLETGGCVAAECHHAPLGAVVATEDLAHVAAEQLPELGDLLLSRLGGRQLGMK